MKKGTWIIVATLFSIGAIVGASALTHTSDSMKQELSAEEQIKAAPKEALDSATIDLKQALARHDAPAVIASLMKQSAARLLIDRDTLPAIIRQTESLADRSKNPVEQSLLRLISARLYHLYLEDNYRIRLRDEVDDFSQPLETWSANMFLAKIDTLLTRATAPVQELLATPVSAYRQALTIGSDSIFRPTLYDFVVGEAIDLYKQESSYSPLQPVARKELLVPAQKFTTLVLDNKKQPDGRILQLYADALKAHAAETGSAPLMMWDLQRLEYLGESLYNNDEEELFGNYIDSLGIETLIDRHHQSKTHAGTNNLINGDIHHRSEVVSRNKLREFEYLALGTLLLLAFLLSRRECFAFLTTPFC